jgi:hypothetical protein
MSLALVACEGKDGVLTEHLPDASTSAASSETSAATTAPDDPTTDSTTDPTTGESETTMQDMPLCPCIVDDSVDMPPEPTSPTCVDMICPTVVGAYAAFCEGMCVEGVMVDSAALECALVALRDRTPGLLRWQLNIEGDLYAGAGYLWIQDDGNAIWRKWEGEDLVFTATPAQIVELPASATYEQCLTEGDVPRFECLRQTLAGPDDFVCDAGWTKEGI